MEGQKSTILLNVYSPDEDVGMRLKFTIWSTVEEALEQATKRLFVDEQSDQRKASLRFFKRNPKSEEGGFYLYKDHTLASYNLEDEVQHLALQSEEEEKFPCKPQIWRGGWGRTKTLDCERKGIME